MSHVALALLVCMHAKVGGMPVLKGCHLLQPLACLAQGTAVHLKSCHVLCEGPLNAV